MSDSRRSHDLPFGLRRFEKPEMALRNDPNNSVDVYVIEPINAVTCVASQSNFGQREDLRSEELTKGL